MTAYTPRQRRVLLSIINQLEEPMAKERTVVEEPTTNDKPRQQTAPNPEFQLLARIDRMLSRVPPEVANRILSMLAAQRMGLALTIAAKPCNSVPLG